MSYVKEKILNGRKRRSCFNKIKCVIPAYIKKTTRKEKYPINISLLLLIYDQNLLNGHHNY